MGGKKTGDFGFSYSLWGFSIVSGSSLIFYLIVFLLFFNNFLTVTGFNNMYYSPSS